jgi:hypothetical protein
MAVHNGTAVPALNLPPLKGSAKYAFDSAVAPAGVMLTDRKASPRMMKCLVVWAIVMTLLCAASGTGLWMVWNQVADLKSEFDLVSGSVGDNAVAVQTNAEQLGVPFANLAATADQALRVATAASQADATFRAQMTLQMEQLLQNISAVIEQRRRAQGCQPGEEPEYEGGPCKECEPGSVSEAGQACLPCPARTVPDTTSTVCIRTDGSVVTPQVFTPPMYLGVAYVLDDPIWLTSTDAKEAMFLAIADALTLERSGIINDFMVPSTGQVVFETLHRNGTSVQSYEAGIRYALWNLAFLNPAHINVTECGLRCVREEQLVAQTVLGGVVSLRNFTEMIADIPGVATSFVTSYVQSAAAAVVLPGSAGEFAAETGGGELRLHQFTSAVAKVVQVEQSEVMVTTVVDAERGRPATVGQYNGGRRRLQSGADFFSIVRARPGRLSALSVP